MARGGAAAVPAGCVRVVVLLAAAAAWSRCPCPARTRAPA